MNKNSIVPICVVGAIAAFHPYAYAAEPGIHVSSMRVIDRDNQSMIALVDVTGLKEHQRLSFGTKRGYDQLGIKFPAAAFDNAQAYIIRLGGGHTAIRLNNIRRPAHDFNIVLANPDTGKLFAWKVPSASKGEFKVALSQNHDPKNIPAMPRLAKVNRTFPSYPQPAIKKSSPPKQAAVRNVAMHEDTPPAADQAAKSIPNDLRLVASTKALKNLSELAANLVPGYHLEHKNGTTALYGPGKHHIKPTIFADMKPEANRWRYRTASYSPDQQNQQERTSVFGWAKTILYRVKQNDISISDVANDILADRSFSIDTVIASLYSFNKEAFGNGDLYVLKKGTILRVPPRTFVEQMQADPNRVKRILLGAAKQV